MIRAVRETTRFAQFTDEVGFCAFHGLELEVSSDVGWIVRIATAHHCGQVIACVDRLDETVELMSISGGFRWSTFDTLQEALNNLVESQSKLGAPAALSIRTDLSDTAESAELAPARVA